MDADLKEKVQGGELFTLVSHPAGEICPGPSHPIQEPAGTQWATVIGKIPRHPYFSNIGLLPVAEIMPIEAMAF